MEWQKRRLFTYLVVWAYHVISRKVKNPSLDTINFLDTHICINNPHWQSRGITVFLYKCYIVISDTLIGSPLIVFLLLLCSWLFTPSTFPSDVLAEEPLYRHITLLWVVFCVMISWVNGQKYENLLHFNTSWNFRLF